MAVRSDQSPAKPYSDVFRSGDVRGLYPSEISDDFAFLFGRAFVAHFGINGRIATGRDSRASSEHLQQALNAGLQSVCVEVSDLGLCATELTYFASMQPEFDASIMVTGSHNQINSNGFKCVLSGGQTISFETGLAEIQRIMERLDSTYARKKQLRSPSARGRCQSVSLAPQYTAFLSELFSLDKGRFSRIAVNGLNGSAVTLVSPLAELLGLSLSWFRKEPGPMPALGADPSRKTLSDEMSSFMAGNSHDFGVAWDSDCDRCVFYDDQGQVLPSSYAVALFAEHFLQTQPGETIVYDTKLVFNTEAVLKRLSGTPAPALTGSAYMRQQMKATGAIYGGESSAHHYFRMFSGCDSGMIAWLSMLKLLQRRSSPLHQLVRQQQDLARCTAEISLTIEDIDRAFSCIEGHYAPSADRVDGFDGLAFWMPGNWRFSLRQSKTEDRVRLNFETKGRTEDLLEEGEQVLKLLQPFCRLIDTQKPSLFVQ